MSDTDKWYLSGPLGIGTADPQASLHVNGDLRIDGGRTIITGFDGDNKHWIKTNAAEPHSVFMSYAANSEGKPLAVHIFPGNIDGLTVNSDGQVGIGRRQKLTNKLHVDSCLGIRQNSLYLSGGPGWSSISYNAYHNEKNDAWNFPDPTKTAVTLEIDDGGKKTGNEGNARFEIFTTTLAKKTEWLSRLIVDGESGNVGIRTREPQASLHVGGELRIDGARTIINGFDGVNNHWIKTNAVEPSSLFMAFSGTYDGKALAVHIRPGNSDGLTVDSNGYVGIKTIDPQAPLDVNGGINARMVTVNGGGSIPLVSIGVQSSGMGEKDIGLLIQQRPLKRGIGLWIRENDNQISNLIEGSTSIFGVAYVKGKMMTKYRGSDEEAKDIMSSMEDDTFFISAGGIDQARLDFYLKYKGKIYVNRMSFDKL